MRELFLITDESDASALVLRADTTPPAATGADTAASTSEDSSATAQDASAQDSTTQGEQATEPQAAEQQPAEQQATEPAAQDAAASSATDGVDEGGEFYLALTDEVKDALRQLLGLETATTSGEKTSSPTPADSTEAKDDSKAEAPAAKNTDAAAAEGGAEKDDAPARPTRDIDPGLSAQLTMRPREIQDRIRGGQSVEEVAAAAGVPVARIQGFAYPVLGERARVAETARQAHPVREDGPAPLTLFEIVATAFAARGLDITTAEWDAFRDPSHQWVVALTWKAGLTTNTAEWSYHGSIGTPDTAVARNALAADLIDPDFARPVRTIAHPNRHSAADDVDDAAEELTRTRDDLRPIRDAKNTSASGASDADAADNADDATLEGESLLTHPEPVKKKPKSRKPSAPAWEDVLLGVRANTKRPRK